MLDALRGPTECAEKTCPLCGSTVDAAAVAVDLKNNRARLGGKDIKLTPQRAEILSILVADYPNRVKCSDIISRLYGLFGDEPGDPASVLHNGIFWIRRQLAGSGWKIINEYGGYRLEDE